MPTVSVKEKTPNIPGEQTGVRDEDRTVKVYERISWWPWGELDKETPEQKKARKEAEKKQKEMFDKAEEGDAGMQLMAGMFFAKEENIEEINIQEALRWFHMALTNEKATSVQLVSANYHYAMCLEIAEIKKGKTEVSDYVQKEIIAHYKTAADIVTPRNSMNTTSNIFKQLACYNVGLNYEKQGNKELAYLYFKKAADLDHIEASYKVAQMCMDEKSDLYEPQVAVGYLKKIASKEHRQAQILLADCYEAGIGVDVDWREMINWLVLAARGEDGLPEAQTKLGKCYATGKGVINDSSLAVRCFQRAADKNYGLAMYELANCYFSGIGVPVDYFKAVQWYEKAVAHNQPAGYYGLGVCAESGLGMTLSLKKAFEYFEKALSENPDMFVARYKLANYYRHGFGNVKRDIAKAVKYYQVAGESGYVEAWLDLAEIFASGENGVKKNMANAEFCISEAERYLRYHPRPGLQEKIALTCERFGISNQNISNE